MQFLYSTGGLLHLNVIISICFHYYIQIRVWKKIAYGQGTDREKLELLHQIQLLRKLHNENVIRYYDYIDRVESATVYVITKFQSCRPEFPRDLGSFIRQLSKQR